MTTSEFIEILKKADPSGNAHIRMSGGIPIDVELKPGYWDGPYSYFDEEGNWIETSEGQKVDIITIDREDFVCEMLGRYKNLSWEEVKGRFKFRLGYSSANQREEDFLRGVKETYDEMTEFYRIDKEKDIKIAIERAERGWRWFQNKKAYEGDQPANIHTIYTWIITDEQGKLRDSNVANVEAVLRSGLFEKIESQERPDYYEWIKK